MYRVLICNMIKSDKYSNEMIIENSQDLSLYLELGHEAASEGDVESARNWYNIGLKIAKNYNDIINEKQFTRFLYTLL